MVARQLLCVGWMLASLFCEQGRASAQSDLTPEQASDTARAWFERGVLLSRTARWPDAREAYLRSLQLEPRASTHFNLAAVSLQLHLARATLLALDDFADTADPRKHAEFLAEAARMRAAALDLTGTVVLVVEPSNATVQVDQEAQQGPVGPTHPISLDPGQHVLQLRAPDHVTSSLAVDIARGVTTQLSATLGKVPLPAPAPETALRARPDDSVWPDIWLWGGIAALGVGALTAVLILTLQRAPTPAPSASGGSLQMVFD